MDQADDQGSRPWTADADGLTLAVRATPRASRTEIVGIQPQVDGRTALAIRVASPPVDGAANDALIAFLAKQLGVPRSKSRVLSGSQGRLKILRIAGHGADLAQRLSILAKSEHGQS